ncbi:MAG: hypothetical protein GF383_05265 [Candidatus Lokiarchaeota archaeon]|nr:hypothetical protein [Candidatus Lokiarchaeota archaeon]MBD3339301.1 hypothetical protein [Candidatus Lokiarchaeota archaeon]
MLSRLIRARKIVEFSERIILGFIFGVIAYLTLYLGKGIEKYAIEGFKGDSKENAKKVNLRSKHSGIWAIGFGLTFVYFLFQWIALFFAPIHLIAPLEGLGLVFLLFFSYFILKESIEKIEILGLGLIIIGTILVAFFNPNIGNVEIIAFKLDVFIITSISILLIEFIFIMISRSYDYRGAGIIIGLTAGTFLALSTVAKRITAIQNLTLTISFSILTMLFSLLAMVCSQIAYAKSDANKVVPCFTSTSIFFSILIGFLALNEIINLIQVIGIFFIIFGIILLTAFKKGISEAIKKETF